jgi:hypothetical protein
MSEHRPQSESELIELVRSIDERAPEHLHERIAALVTESQERPRRHSRAPVRLDWRLGSGVAALAALALALALVLVLTLTGTGHTGLSLREASALTLDRATLPAPGENSSQRAELNASVDGISFPYWSKRFGWQASGSRTDRVAGRAVRTVFYLDSQGQRIGYAIVAGTPAPTISSGAPHWRDGTAYTVSDEHGAKVVTWIRDGHLCIVSGRGVSAPTLLSLAGWDDHDEVS